MKNAIFGTGPFTRRIYNLLLDTGVDRQNIIFVSDKYFNPIKLGNGVEIDVIPINELKGDINFYFGVGDPHTKREISETYGFRRETCAFNFPNVVHPSVIQEEYIEYGIGNLVITGNILAVGVKICNFVTVNSACTIGHDAILGDYVQISPQVHISGYVEIGECTYIGAGAIILEKIRVGKNSVVGAGAVVVKDVPDNVVVAGVPAKVIRHI